MVIGETIGHFKVVSRLGRGGMGEVFAGEHESIQTRVAIKVLQPEVSQNAEHVQRFFNEAKIVSRIKHSGIVKIFDVGTYREHAYLIMELLEGEPLATRIHRRGRLPWQDTTDIGRQIASVLEATHRAGVIHRDLKPDNIFLVVDHELASGERVKVLDFGISKLSGTVAPNSPKTVGTMGTPAYMAPEQWGDSGNVDWRADAYSLGCVLFEMACGRPPFVVHTIAEACAKHLHATPPAPGALAALPENLDALIRRLLAKNPIERGASMAALARELAEIAASPGPLTAALSASDAMPAALAVTVPPTLHTGDDTHGMATANERPSGRAAPVAATTLGHSAGEIRIDAPHAPRRKLVLALGGGALAIAGVVIALVARSTSPSTSTATSTPTSQPTSLTTSPSGSGSGSGSASGSGSGSVSGSGSGSASASASGSGSASVAASGSASVAASGSGSASASVAASGSGSVSAAPSKRRKATVIKPGTGSGSGSAGDNGFGGRI